MLKEASLGVNFIRQAEHVKKSELVTILTQKQPNLFVKDVELAVSCIIEQLTQTLTDGKRIEIRGFGSFSLRERKARIGRNPKTGESVSVTRSFSVHFKPANALRDKANDSKNHFRIVD